MEDFVTYELAVKLKEKGFTCQYPIAMYNENGVFHELCTSVGCMQYYYYEDFDEHDFIAPTISQVLKWLRGEKGLHICIDIYDDGWFFDVTHFYETGTGVYEIKLPYKSSNVTPDYESYEQAALAGIEYCLDNLI